MTAKKRLRAWTLGALIATLLVPAGLAAGTGKNNNKPSTDRTDVVLLVLGKSDYIKWGKAKQAVSGKSCDTARIGTSPDILGISAIGGNLTLKDDGFGVKGDKKSSSSCGSVGKGESISVTMGTALDGLVMSAIDVDLEVEKKTKIGISFLFRGTQVASDTFEPNAKKDGDNFRYFKRPTSGGQPVYFDQVVFTTISGAFSLEGGSDYSKGGTGKIDTKSTASQFEVVKAFDGEITCGDTATISDPAVDTVIGQVTMHAMNSGVWQTGGCDLKLYNQDVTDDTITFVPFLEGTSARYTMALTVEGQPIVIEDGLIVSLGLTYDPAGGPNPTQTLQACAGQPVLSGPGYDAFWQQANVGLLPAGESACFYQVGLEDIAGGVGTELWGVYFEDDPSWGFK